MSTKQKTKQLFNFIPVLLLIFSSCIDEDNTPKTLPAVSDIEVGLHNNEIGVIDDDFHFNAEVLAGDLLEAVQVDIIQKSEENYEKEWSFQIIFTDRIEGLKNASLHRHFSIPAEAPRGKYDFIITVIDQNGTSLEEVREINIIDAADYPEVSPYVSVFGIDRIDTEGKSGFNNFYNNGNFQNPNAAFFSKDESIWSTFQIGNTKGDGIMYGLLIKTSHNHKPENIEEIDFNKVIVTEYLEHNGEEEVFVLKNNRDTGHWNYGPVLKIGAEKDNNLPDPYSITESKDWGNGSYYYGVVYTNLSYNRSTYKYITFEIKGF